MSRLRQRDLFAQSCIDRSIEVVTQNQLPLPLPLPIPESELFLLNSAPFTVRSEDPLAEIPNLSPIPMT